MEAPSIRNFFMAGHTGSGKTTLTDALLFKLGLNDRLGSVDSGSSMADYTEEEKSHKITIFSKPFAGNYKGGDGKQYRMVFTDTPGYMDFFGQVVSAARSAETCMLVVDASSGVQVGARKIWRYCNKEGLARGIVITGLDKENVDFEKTLSEVQSAFGDHCVPVVIPGDEGNFIDVLAAKDVAGSAAARAEELKGSLVELAAETDDTMIEKFLGGEDLAPEEIANGLRKAVAGATFVPVFACSPKQESGVNEMLNGIARLFPSPADTERKDKDGGAIGVKTDDPFVGFVWRTVNDPFVGQLAFVRVLGGVIKSDAEVNNASREHKEKVGSLLLVNGKKQEQVSEAVAGEIVAIPKLKDTKVNDTLCAPGSSVICAPMKFPSPVASQAVTAKTQADEDKIGTALAKLADEDPTIKVERNSATKEVVLKGLGDVHLDVSLELMRNRSKVEAELHTPKVPYRETVTGRGEGHYKHKKQSGGRGQYGEVYLRVEPKQPDEEEWFVDAVVGGVIPGNFMPAVQKGLVEGMTSGALAGYPITNVKITVYDGSYHDVDSSEIAFKIAASRALREAMLNAKPVLLEPIMKVKVLIPDHAMGDVNGDLNQKRGRILGMGAEDGLQSITAEVPEAELFRYAAELRSVTAGQGTFEMEFSRYDVVPANVAQKVIAESKKDEEE